MKRISKMSAVAACLLLFAVMAMGSGSSSDSSSSAKAGEAAQDTTTEQGTAAEQDSATEVKTEYHVGDILKDGDVQIVYAASGEYQEENEYMKPEEGKKCIFLKLAFENQGTSDQSISSLNFECYADGYNADTHYTENDFSATLSPGRTTEGMLVFEVPQDAQNIEVEYETNFITEEKLKFIYDGDKDSGYVAEAKTGASENTYAVGDIVESQNLNIQSRQPVCIMLL